MMSNAYYDIPKEHRWLDGTDSPEEIGGCTTDVAQIAYSLEHRIKEMYGVNQVPEEIATSLVALWH